MIALTSPWLWFTARASGLVALVLLSAIMVLGALTTTRAGGKRVLRFEIAEMHKRLSLLALVFVGVHVAMTVFDTYVHTGIVSAFIPMTSAYKTLYVSLGAIALDSMLAVWITSMLRARMSIGAWRAVHWLAYLAWPIAIIHTLLIGSDIKHHWAQLSVLACVALVLLSIGYRIVWSRRAVPAGTRTVLHPHPRGASTPPAPASASGSRRGRSGPNGAREVPKRSVRPVAESKAAPRQPEGRRVASTRRES